MLSKLVFVPNMSVPGRPLVLGGDLRYGHQRSLVELRCEQRQIVGLCEYAQIRKYIQHPIASHS